MMDEFHALGPNTGWMAMGPKGYLLPARDLVFNVLFDMKIKQAWSMTRL
jgi:hypothetical protein